MKSFRINAKNLFLTYPKCDATREDMRDHLYKLLDADYGVVKYIVAKEKHQDGTDHLHCFVELNKKLNVQNASYFDYNGHHGNYQSSRSPFATAKYCIKDDKEYLANFQDLKELKGSKKVSGEDNGPSKRDMIAEELLGGTSITDIIKKYPGELFNIQKWQQALDYFHRLSREYLEWPQFLPNTWGKLLPTHREAKKRHYWIWSNQPDRYKTTNLKSWEKYGFYIKSGDYTYWNVTGDERGIGLDDYNTPSLKYNFINQLCDGTAELRVFMGGVVNVKPLIVICSNQPPELLYPNMYPLLYARFNVICVD